MNLASCLFALLFSRRSEAGSGTALSPQLPTELSTEIPHITHTFTQNDIQTPWTDLPQCFLATKVIL